MGRAIKRSRYSWTCATEIRFCACCRRRKYCLRSRPPRSPERGHHAPPIPTGRDGCKEYPRSGRLECTMRRLPKRRELELPSVAVSFVEKLARDGFPEAEPVLSAELLHSPDGFRARRCDRNARFQPAAKGFQSDIQHVLGVFYKSGLDRHVNDLGVFRLELDGHGTLSLSVSAPA